MLKATELFMNEIENEIAPLKKIIDKMDLARTEPIKKNLDRYIIRSTIKYANKEFVELFNELYHELLREGYSRVIWTPCGAISKYNWRRLAWDVDVKSSNMVKMTLLTPWGYYVIDIRFSRGDSNKSTNEDNEDVERLTVGREWNLFRKVLRENGCDLDKMRLDDETARATKKQIPKTMIKMANPTWASKDKNHAKIFTNAHHIDLNSAFPAGIAKAFPATRKGIEYFYNRRKTNPMYKDVLNHAFGKMQQRDDKMGNCNAHWAHMSKAAVEFTNSYLEDLTQRLRATGHTILAYNTDGIWYTGTIFHDVDEGTALGQWKNDYTNCRIRFKSAGCYEFEEQTAGGKIYRAKMRGSSKYDKIVAREFWTWGDIFRNGADAIKHRFVEGEGIIEVGDEEELWQM